MGRTIFAVLVLAIACLAAVGRGQVLDPRMHHLRGGDEAEWQEFEGKTPEAKSLNFHFQAQANKDAVTLFIRQVDVKVEWNVKLNGTNIGKLFLMEYPLVHALKLPPNLLRDGDNALSIVPPKENDDILVGDFRFGKMDATLDAEVNGPCRITVTDAQGHLAALEATNGRPGVVYTATGKTSIKLPSGAYTVYASRGFEYSLARTNVTLAAGQRASIKLRIDREVQTPGLVSC